MIQATHATRTKLPSGPLDDESDKLLRKCSEGGWFENDDLFWAQLIIPKDVFVAQIKIHVDSAYSWRAAQAAKAGKWQTKPNLFLACSKIIIFTPGIILIFIEMRASFDWFY